MRAAQATPSPPQTNPMKELIVSLELKSLILTSLKNREFSFNNKMTKCLQRLRNTIRELPWSVHVNIHSDFSNDLKNINNDIKATLTGYKR